jgi:KaiC/GvpD/RAD55 family RecA-like ATPase
MTDPIRQIVRDAFKVDELVYQFTEIDVSDKLLVHGSLEEVSDKFDDDYIVREAEDRLAVVQENIDYLYDWDDDMKMYRRDQRQLTRFIKKWRAET